MDNVSPIGTGGHILNEEFELQVDDSIDIYDDMVKLSPNHSGMQGITKRPSNGSSLPPTPPVSSENSVSRNHSTNSAKANVNSPRTGLTHRDSMTMTPMRKYQCIIGNLTWWTTGEDINAMLLEIGVEDFVEVKFYENRINGQSKGYCVVTLGSDASLELTGRKLPANVKHGLHPIVSPVTKVAISQFDAVAVTRRCGPGGGTGGGHPEGGDMDMNTSGGPRGPMSPQFGMGYRGPNHGMNPGQHAPRGGRPPPPGPHRGMGPNMHYSNFGGPPRPMMPPNHNHHMAGPPGILGPFYHGSGPPPMGPHGPMPLMMGSRGPPFPGPGPCRQDYRPSFPQQGPPIPAPHMNPSFFQSRGPAPMGQGQGCPPPSAPYNVNFNAGSPGGGGQAPIRPYNANFNSGSPVTPPKPFEPVPPIPEVEFDEVMGRNRMVSSSAISRAVSDAATGEFASAIETLVTAISLIKQSRIAQDDRCKILVSSLHDTLHGIETKSYGRTHPKREIIVNRSRSREKERLRRSSRHERSRSRSRGREREYRGRSRDRYYQHGRDRDRSRSREYRDRERAREELSRAHFEERFRDKDRERELRSSRTLSDRAREEDQERDIHRTLHH